MLMKSPRQLGLAVAAILAGASALAADPTPVVVDRPISPPPPRPEVITKEPSAESVWIPGYWERDPSQWSWVAGHWEKPPFLPARWVGGYWKYQTGQYHWHPGHWAVAENGVIVNKPVAIPPLPPEPPPPPPPPDRTWVRGRWEWNDGWTWVPGYYAVKPAPAATWVSGHWKEGLLGNWRWTAGHWTVP
jgi:hypothetical protein